MYQPFANMNASAATSGTVAQDGPAEEFYQHLLEAAALEAELSADGVVAYVNAATSDFVAETKAVLSASLDGRGLDATGAQVLNAATNLLKRLGYQDAPVIAGESFDSEANCLTQTMLAGEAFDIKAKAIAAWEWIKKMLSKAKAWVLKLFDGATSLAKSFRGLKEANQKKIQSGKTAESGAKFKLSKAQQKQLSLATTGPAVTASAVKGLVKALQGEIDFVFDTNFTAIKKSIDGLGTLVEYVTADTLKAKQGADMITHVNKVMPKLNEAANKDERAVGNLMQVAHKEVKSEDIAEINATDQTPSVILREAGKLLGIRLYTISAIDGAKDAKFTDGKEYSVVGLDEVNAICDAAIPALEAIARAKDNFNKGMQCERDLEATIKSISALGEDVNAAAPALLDISTKLGTALRDPVGAFSANFVGVLSSVYAVAKQSSDKYTK